LGSSDSILESQVGQQADQIINTATSNIDS